MAALATIKVEMTPEIRRAIDFLGPIAETSNALFDCLCEFDGEPGCEDACAEKREAWERAVINGRTYTNHEGAES